MAETRKGQWPTPPNHVFLFPTRTPDYRVSRGELGLGLVANRNIKKGKPIFRDSLEYTFSNVIDGDQLLFDCGYYKKARGLAKATLPQFSPLTRDTLIETHGVSELIPDPTGQTAGTENYMLEVPGMLMNHSCNPNAVCVDDDDYATRDIKKGEELTCDYALYVYYENQPYPECKCGSSNCRGKMTGFRGLTDAQKQNIFHRASSTVQAHHKADIGEGPPVIEAEDAEDEDEEDIPVRTLSPDDENVPRLVCPGPGAGDNSVAVKPIGTGEGEFGLFAMRDFRSGEQVYEFFCQPWPKLLPSKFDMVAPIPETDGDLPEGTIIHINAQSCAHKYRSGAMKFSCWDLLAADSSEPNLLYKDRGDQDWCSAYAARDIRAGEQLTADRSSMISN